MLALIQQQAASRNARLKPITLETSCMRRVTSSDCLVEGPYDDEYGRLTIGRIIKGDNGRFAAYGVYGGDIGGYDLGEHKRIKHAQTAVADYAQNYHRPEALHAEFGHLTAGGIPIVFLRRVVSGIVAVAPDFITTWSLDGQIQLFNLDGQMFSDEPEAAERYRLEIRADFKPKYQRWPERAMA